MNVFCSKDLIIHNQILNQKLKGFQDKKLVSEKSFT